MFFVKADLNLTFLGVVDYKSFTSTYCFYSLEMLFDSLLFDKNFVSYLTDFFGGKVSCEISTISGFEICGTFFEILYHFATEEGSPARVPDDAPEMQYLRMMMGKK